MNFWRRVVFQLLLGLPLVLLGNEEHHDAEYETYVYEIVDTYEHVMEEELGLKLIRWGGDFRDYLKEGFSFNAYRRATIDEARALELAAIEGLIKVLSEHKLIQTYLKEYSIIPEDIGLGIYFTPPHKVGYNDGSVRQVYNPRQKESSRGIRIDSKNPFWDYGSKTLDQAFKEHTIESFAEANMHNQKASLENLAFHKPTLFENALNDTLDSFAKEVKRKHHLDLSSIGWMVSGKPTDGIEEIRALGTIMSPSNPAEARDLILNITQILLNRLNHHEELRPYLKEYPFPSSSIKLQICFRKLSFAGTSPYTGSVDRVVLSEDLITYQICDPSIEGYPTIKPSVEESYQEAVQLNSNGPCLTVSYKISKAMKIICNKLRNLFVSLVLMNFLMVFSGTFLIVCMIVVAIICLVKCML